MGKFITLMKKNEKGELHEEEDWNTDYIKNYRRWKSNTNGGKDLTVVFTVNPKTGIEGRLIVDNTVENIRQQIKEK